MQESFFFAGDLFFQPRDSLVSGCSPWSVDFWLASAHAQKCFPLVDGWSQPPETKAYLPNRLGEAAKSEEPVAQTLGSTSVRRTRGSELL